MKKHFCFKRIVAFSLSLLFLFLPFPFTAFADESGSVVPFPTVSGASEIFLYHYESDKVIFNKSSGDRIAPASTVKIVTGLVALNLLRNRLDERVIITADMLRDVEGYTVGLRAGDDLTIKDLLYGLICGCGNDAAMALAILCSGSAENFVEEMNNTVKSFGCTDTNFMNPTGIDSSSATTSLNDIVIISKKAVEDEIFMSMCSVSGYTFTTAIGEEKTFRNRNPLISPHFAMGYQNKRVKGLNAGMTDRGGYCISAYATNGTDSYLCIVMGGKETQDGNISSYKIANTLINHAFDNYSYGKIADKGTAFGRLEVQYALPSNGNESVTVTCVLKDDVYSYAPVNNDIKSLLTYNTYYFEDLISAPVYAGTPVGGVDIYYDGYYLASGILITEQDVQASKLLLIISGMKKFMLSRPVIIFVVVAIISICTYFCFTVWRKNKK